MKQAGGNTPSGIAAFATAAGVTNATAQRIANAVFGTRAGTGSPSSKPAPPQARAAGASKSAAPPPLTALAASAGISTGRLQAGLLAMKQAGGNTPSGIAGFRDRGRRDERDRTADCERRVRNPGRSQVSRAGIASPCTMDRMRVLVVDDDAAVRQSLATALGRDGYDVLAAEDGNAALAHLVAASVDAIVLDVAMREPNGLEVCRRLRARGDRTPILMLTARDLVDDRVAGLDAGADDYLVKPFALAELRARLRALLRRNAASAEQLSYADLALDLAAAQVTRGGREVALTRTEYLLLELFLRNPGRVLSHSQIFQAVWGYDFGLRSNNLWVYMGYLRTKLEAAGEPRILHTVRGLGYVLRDKP